MTTAQMLVKIKEAMRISHTALDVTLSDDIEAGALELERSGVSVYEDGELKSNALVENAIRYYVFAVEDYNGKAQQYHQSFEKLRNAMAQSEAYKLTEEDDAG
jgi:hypothetical protein